MKYAVEDQSSSMLYDYDDSWRPCHLEGGTRLYQLDFCKDDECSQPSSYFIDQDTYNKYCRADGSFDVKRYCNDAQIKPYFDGTYKNHISEYTIPDGGMDVETGIAENNTWYGDGGCKQYYIDQERLQQIEKEDFVSPTIGEEDRTIGREEADKRISSAISHNLEKYPEYAHASNQNETLSAVASELPEETNENNNETMKNEADQNALPNNQGQGTDNTISNTESNSVAQ